MQIRPLIASALLSVGCSDGPGPTPENPDWTPDGRAVVWHHTHARLADRPEWGAGGRDPTADFLTDDGLARYELVLELHSASPEQTGADWDTWDWPLYFGVGEPLLDRDGALHMFECTAGGAVYQGDGYYAFCRPGTAILLIAFPATTPVPVDEAPAPPEPFGAWWCDELSFARGTEAERWQDLAVVTKYAFYGKSAAGYEVPVTFHPHAVEPADAAAPTERWRVAYFDDREL